MALYIETITFTASNKPFMSLPVFSIQYIGNIELYYWIQQFPEIKIEAAEHYIKQTFRNRTNILSANGILPLIIPVIHKSSKEKIIEKEICYKEKWYKKHFTAVVSAYKKAPYYEHYADDLLELLKHPQDRYLFDYTIKWIRKICSLLDISTKILYTDQYEKYYEKDFRTYFDQPHQIPHHLLTPYIQVFSDRFVFHPNLSVLDLIFNLGPDAKHYIKAD